MTLDEALDVFELSIFWRDEECFCYKDNMCERCRCLPSKEDQEEAEEIINGDYL